MDALINMVNVPSLAHSGPLSSLVTNLLNIINSSVTHASSPEERVNNILMLSGMGIDSDPTARLILNEKTDSVALDRKYDLKQIIFTDIIGAMKEFAAQTGKDGEESLIIPFWDSDPNARTQFVLHPLGGCPMGLDASVGIVNHLGQLFRGSAGRDPYDDFYVIDGSIIPTPIGVNPSLPISALAFRIAGERFGKDNLS
jgi:cholesterol oxidase